MRMISVDDIPRRLEDTVHTAVGLGILGFQQVQVQRQQLRRSLSSSYGGACAAIGDRAKVVEQRMAGLDDRVDAVLESVEPRLPAPARGAAHQALSAARQARSHLFGLVERRGGSD